MKQVIGATVALLICGAINGVVAHFAGEFWATASILPSLMLLVCLCQR